MPRGLATTPLGAHAQRHNRLLGSLRRAELALLEVATAPSVTNMDARQAAYLYDMIVILNKSVRANRNDEQVR